MDRSRLINKWLGEANISIQTKEVKSNFINMLDCLSDIELMKPFIFRDKKAGMSYKAISIKYSISIKTVRHHFDCAVKGQGITANIVDDNN